MATPAASPAAPAAPDAPDAPASPVAPDTPGARTARNLARSIELTEADAKAELYTARAEFHEAEQESVKLAASIAKAKQKIAEVGAILDAAEAAAAKVAAAEAAAGSSGPAH